MEKTNKISIVTRQTKMVHASEPGARDAYRNGGVVFDVDEGEELRSFAEKNQIVYAPRSVSGLLFGDEKVLCLCQKKP